MSPVGGESRIPMRRTATQIGPSCEQVPPPKAMPGWCVVVPCEPPATGMHAGVVVEMGWVDDESLVFPFSPPPFAVGDRIIHVGGIDLSGYELVGVTQVVAWSPEPGVAR